MFVKVALLGSIIAFSFIDAASAQVEKCEAALIVDNTTKFDLLEMQLTMLQSVEQKTYDEMKRGGSVTLPIPDFPVTAGWDEFQKKRTEYLKRFSFNYNRDEAHAYYSTRMPDNSVTNYMNCLLAVKKSGFEAYLANATPEHATLLIQYVAPPLSEQVLYLKKAKVVGASRPAIKRRWGPGNDNDVTILDRSPNEELRIAITISGYVLSPYIPAPPTVKKAVFKWVAVGTGDCDSNDRSCSRGASPQESNCNEDTLGTAAICFPGAMNGKSLGCGTVDWCTYKKLQSNQCEGGVMRGASKYKCVIDLEDTKKKLKK